MKNTVKFVLFLIYTIVIFLINDYKLLGIVALINIFFIILLKLNIKNMIISLAKLFIFIMFTIIVNIFLESINYAIMVGIKLILICNITYIFSKTISYMEFAKVIENIFYPLKIFGVNPKNIGLIICIALAFVPILKKELEEFKDVLKIKGFKVTLINILKNITLIGKPFFVSILRKVNDIENSLMIKGYE